MRHVTESQFIRTDKVAGLAIYTAARKTAIRPSPKFKKKGLATHAVEVGFKCGHECAYCSAPASLRTNSVFKSAKRSPYARNYAVVDPDVPDRLAAEVDQLGPDDTVMLCTLSDAWSPEAHEHGLGRSCLEILLNDSPAQVRVLTKNTAVRRDFDLIEKYRDRVTIGLSVTGLPEHDETIKLIEPFAAPVSERIDTMTEARQRRLRVYAMLCPVMPGLFSEADDVSRLMQMAKDWNVEDIWIEPLNPRGPALKNCEAAWAQGGHADLARAVHSIRTKECWDQYALWVTQTMQTVARELGLIEKLHILNYRSGYSAWAQEIINRDPEAVTWL